jgi:Protein of unknown function (DUF3619)
MTHGLKQSFSSQDVFARRIVNELDASLEDVPHHVSERLRAARVRALTLRKQKAPVPLYSASMHIQNGVATLGAGPGTGQLWEKMVSFLPLLVLLLGLMFIYEHQNDFRARELADVDQALLLDDLPPDAYTDPGFLKFLSVPRESIEGPQ